MSAISTARLNDCLTWHSAETIRTTVVRFCRLLSEAGVQSVRVWCSWNPDLPEDSPLQSPEATISPDLVPAFLDAAVKNGVWTYGDSWNRAGIDAPDCSFRFFLGNDQDIRFETNDSCLLEAVRADWVTAGYEVHESEHEDE